MLERIDSSYGTILAGQQMDADGFLRKQKYGDYAGTEITITPDVVRRAQAVVINRTLDVPGANAVPPPPDGSTTQMELANTTVSYDDVDNIVAMADNRSAALWPTGSKPTSRTMTYDNHYRLSAIAYSHGSDAFVSPFAFENGVGDVRPIPQFGAVGRIESQAFNYDGFGNLTSFVDNSSVTFDRGLGAITTGASTGKPDQLLSTDGFDGSGGRGVRAYHDDAGNLAGLDVERDTGCLGPTFHCAQRYLYEWDEVNQLRRARRWDLSTLSGVAAYPAEPSATSATELKFQYSGGSRVIKSLKDAAGAQRHTVDIFSTLRLFETPYEAPSNNYGRGADYETVYLNGAQIFDAPGLPTVNGNNRHMFLRLTDHLGSAGIVIDHATSEVVEQVTYQAYGGTESDYRPARWASYRTDNRFTGKEEDVESGLVYFGARYYSPHLGRFISPDPLTVHALGADSNPYAYVAGRVMTHVDPFGLQGKERDSSNNACGIECWWMNVDPGGGGGGDGGGGGEGPWDPGPQRGRGGVSSPPPAASPPAPIVRAYSSLLGLPILPPAIDATYAESNAASPFKWGDLVKGFYSVGLDHLRMENSARHPFGGGVPPELFNLGQQAAACEGYECTFGKVLGMGVLTLGTMGEGLLERGGVAAAEAAPNIVYRGLAAGEDAAGGWLPEHQTQPRATSPPTTSRGR